jgi:alanine racemase
LKISASDIARIVNGKLTGNPDLPVTELITDSRHLNYTEGKAFFAIKGKNHDGHQYIPKLIKDGIRIFIVEYLPAGTDLQSDTAFILTQSVVGALQMLAAHKRRSFRSPVIAITGSAGKTIVKEWLAEILGQIEPVVRSPRSYNSQIGVPLSVWKLNEKYRMAIFEAGISMPGEMDALREIIEPDIGVITNIGDAHSENFISKAAKAAEKLKLFINSSQIIYCSDNALIHNLIITDPILKSKRLIDWSTENQQAAIYVNIVSLAGDGSFLKMTFSGIRHEFHIPFTDRASVENAITTASVCLALNTDPAIIEKGLASLVSVAMRMEIKNGINNCQLIEDFYNSDPGSLDMAIESLGSTRPVRTTLILSDFEQSGREEKELYREVAELVKRSGIDRFAGIGPALSRNYSLFGDGSVFYYSTDEFIQKFNPGEFRDEIILLKGARKYEFEKIGRLLEQQAHQTVLEVSFDAISHNLNEFRNHLYPGTRIMAMVKAFAYGSGPAEIASLLEFHRVSYLAVAYADEGVELRNAGITLPVMVMNPDPSSFGQMISYNLEPEIYSFLSLEKFSDVATRYGLLHYPVHIKIDTGMHRLGFMPDEVPELCRRLSRNELIRVISVFSHFAAGDDPVYDEFTRKQADLFQEAASLIGNSTGYSFMRHICNSSAIVRFPEYQFDMVRPGIGIYGVGNLAGLDLKPVGRFITRISQIKIIPGGEPVGYGCSDISDEDRVIAVLPVGYADGLTRRLGNRKGNLFIRNTRVPIIGNICMDMCMADVTGTGAEEGDEAEIFGENIKIDEIAGICQTIPYEILTSIPGRVKRVFYRG